MTDRAWFSRLLCHPTMKWSGSSPSTRSPQGARLPELARGNGDEGRTSTR